MRVRVIALIVGVVVVLTGCGSDGTEPTAENAYMTDVFKREK